MDAFYQSHWVLTFLIFFPLLGALAAWLSGEEGARPVALATGVIELLVCTERHRRVQARAAGEQPADFVLAVDDDDELRHEAIEAGVRAPREQAQRIGDEARGRDEGGELPVQLAVGGGQHRRPF